MIQAIIKTTFYLAFVLSAIYFGGVSILGTYGFTATIGLLSLLYLILSHFSASRMRAQTYFCYGQSAGLLLVLWIMSLCVSALFSHYQPSSFSMLAQFITYFLVFILVVNVLDHQGQRSLGTVLFILGVALSIFGVISLCSDKTVLFSFEKHAYANRLTSTFINPNHFATFIGMLLPFSIPLFIRANRLKRFLIACGSFVMLIAFFLTFSLSGYLALFVAALALYFMYGSFIAKEKLSKKAFFIKVTLLFIIVSVIIVTMVKLSPAFITAKFFSLWQREGLYRGIITMIFTGENPLVNTVPRFIIGGGLGCFREIFCGFYGNYSIAEFLRAHNEYIELFLEVGIVGLTLFVLFVGYLMHRTVKYIIFHPNDENTMMTIACSISFLFVVIQACFDFPLRIPFLGAMFFLMAGIMTRNTARNESSIVIRRVVQVSIAVLSVIAVVISLQELVVGNLIARAERYLEAKQFDRVQACFELAERLSPNNAMVNENHGLALQYQAKLNEEDTQDLYYESLMQYQQAIHKNPFVPKYYFQVGWILHHRGETDEARRFFDKGVSLNEHFLLSYLERANFSHYNGDIIQASDDYNFILDRVMAIPFSSDNRVRLLVNEIHSNMLEHKMDPRLQETYDKIAEYFESIGQ